MVFRTLILCALVQLAVAAPKIVLTNDDGWAVAHIRAQYSALEAAGYDVILSAPAQNESGTGSSSKTATTLTSACEYNSCPKGSPAEGSDPSNDKLNYVNAYPADSANFGIKTLAPDLFGSAPDFVVSGPNVGANIGIATTLSGTVGAASAAVIAGIPSIAVSGSTGSQVSYTTLTSDPSSANSQAAQIYSQATLRLVNALLAGSKPYLPSGVSLNVNYPPISSACASGDDFQFVLSRIYNNIFVDDVNTCGSKHLPSENDVVTASGCYASVSPFIASKDLIKSEASVADQATVISKLSSIITCLPS
ncbi:unnamed protein product [Mycena citricolor]|uniref:Survival protein SurE-like phosphatase/nucleotidase domain-containing protein n=1 Tax=Mycena citricolor TaxID=2018698 RepID=A0AAD2HA12_9AGAR|nr:unnamed protein product [Mycena citricolor]